MAGKADLGAHGLKNEPNVVPMIDILLVLLITFMVIQPLLRRAIDLQLPDPTVEPPKDQQKNPDQIVLEVLPGGQYAVNKTPYTKDALPAGLKSIYDPRPDKIMFVKGDGSVKYQDVIWAMDVARGAGVKVIGVPPKDAAAAAPAK
jgi:biopolymer transport protein ExbD